MQRFFKIFDESLGYHKDGFYLKPVFIFIFLSALVVFRNTFPLAFPTLYAEDGVWIGKIFFNGYIDTAFHARNEFPVVGLVSLLWAAIKLNGLLFLNDISQLPISIYIISTLFLGSLFTYVYCSFKDELGRVGSLVLVLLLALLPVGMHGDEIFGRIGNLVWYSIIVATISLYEIVFNKKLSKFKAFFSMFILLIAVFTFPLVLGQIFIAIFFLKNEANKTVGVKTYLFSLGLIFTLGLYFVLSGDFMSKGGATNLSINYNSFVEFLLARAVLFPVVAPFYGLLNDFIVCLILFLLLGLIIFSYNQQQDKLTRKKYLFFLGLFVFCVIATSASRAGLSSLFHDYKGTYPDRYFIGLNSLFIIALIYILLTAYKDIYKKFILSIFIMLGVTWVISLNIFERSQPAAGSRGLGTLRDTICDVVSLKYLDIQNGRNKVVPIYPIMEGYPWRFDIPDNLFASSAILQCIKREK